MTSRSRAARTQRLDGTRDCVGGEEPDAQQDRVAAVSWVVLAPLILLATLIFFVPGAAMAAALGIRGTMVFVAGPPLTMGLIAGSAIVLGGLHLPWVPVTFFATSLLVIGIVYLSWQAIRVFAGYRLLCSGSLDLRSLLVGLGVTGVVMTTVLVVVFPDPNLFAQTFDNIFHTNAIQYIIDTGNASSFAIAQVTSAGRPAVAYPAAWHGFVALILGVARVVEPTVTVAAAINAGTLTVFVGGWGMGVLTLTQVVAGRSISAAIMASGLASTMPLVPWFYLEWGSLYPNTLANAMVPGLLAILLLLRRTPKDASPPTRAASNPVHMAEDQVTAGVSPARRLVDTGLQVALDNTRRAQRAIEPARVALDGSYPRVALAVVAIASLPGLALAHPNAAFTLGLAVLVVAWGTLFTSLRPHPNRHLVKYAIGGSALLAATIAFCLAWAGLAPENPVDPPEPIPLWTALQGLFLAAPAEASPTWALPAIIAIGLIVCVRQRRFVHIALWLIPSAIYIVALTTEVPEVSLLLGGLFFQDPRRIAASVVVLSLPLILSSFGALTSLFSWLTRWVRPPSGRALAASLLAVSVGLGLVYTNFELSLGPRIERTRAVLYDQSPASRYVSADERTLMSRMRAELPPDAKVIGDPGNGTPFIYSLAGIPVVFGHVFTNDSPAMAQVRKHLFDKAQLDATCQALRDLHAYYFADFGSGSQYFAGFKFYPGLWPVDYKFLTLVDSQVDARLYRITACE